MGGFNSRGKNGRQPTKRLWGGGGHTRHIHLQGDGKGNGGKKNKNKQPVKGGVRMKGENHPLKKHTLQVYQSGGSGGRAKRKRKKSNRGLHRERTVIASSHNPTREREDAFTVQASDT